MNWIIDKYLIWKTKLFFLLWSKFSNIITHVFERFEFFLKHKMRSKHIYFDCFIIYEIKTFWFCCYDWLSQYASIYKFRNWFHFKSFNYFRDVVASCNLIYSKKWWKWNKMKEIFFLKIKKSFLNAREFLLMNDEQY